MKTAEEYYLEHFHTNKLPKGVGILEKDYDYRELIGFAEQYANSALQEAAEKAKLQVETPEGFHQSETQYADCRVIKVCKESILSLQINITKE